ncbi:MAG: GNAT family N-acetyltransferase [Pseudomonadota bacterium]
MIHVRSAGPMDAGPMVELLNEIIAAGGTTSMTDPLTRNDLMEWMHHHVGRNAWVLAEGSDGEVLGFQWIEPKESLPPEACDIATFARIGRTRLGTGSALFEATRAAAKMLGYHWINATIRADNAGGLAYYQSRGFETYKTMRDVILRDGLRIDRISKRFNLD